MAQFPTEATTFVSSDPPTSDGIIAFGNIFNASLACIFSDDIPVSSFTALGWRYHLIGGVQSQSYHNILSFNFSETSPQYAEISGEFRFEV